MAGRGRTGPATRHISRRTSIAAWTYMGLKKRLGGVPIVRRKASKPAFVETDYAACRPRRRSASSSLSPSGAGKVRIQWKASAPPEWRSLLRAWREAEG